MKTLWTYPLLIGMVLHLSVSIEPNHHNQRINGMIEKKVAEANSAHEHSLNVSYHTKVGLLKHLSQHDDTASRLKDDVSSTHSQVRQLVQHLAERLSERSRDPGSSSSSSSTDPRPTHRLQSTLDAHGVSDSLVQEINNMATSSISREHLVLHVQSHFPHKQSHELNDIVVAAIAVQGHRQPDSSDRSKAIQLEMAMDRARFDSAKKTMDFVKASL